MPVENFGLADSEFKSLTTHILDQNGQMQLASSGYFECICILCLFHTKGDICIQFPEKTIPDVPAGHIFALLSGKRRVIDNKMHGNRRL